MAVVSVALIKFQGESHRYVVPIDDFEDFKPRHVDDFDEKGSYSVRWNVLRREDSETTHQDYNAKVFLLAADDEDMIRRADERKVKLPLGYRERIRKELRDKANALKLKHDTSKTGSKSNISSRKEALVLKKAAKKEEKKRMEYILKKNTELLNKPAHPSATPTGDSLGKSPLSVKQKLFIDNTEQSLTPSKRRAEETLPHEPEGKKVKSMKTKKSPSKPNVANESPSKPHFSNGGKTKTSQLQLTVKSATPPKDLKISNSQDEIAKKVEATTPHMDQTPNEVKQKAIRPKRGGKKSKTYDSDLDSTSVDGSYISSETEIETLKSKIMVLQSKLSTAQTQLRIMNTNMQTLKDILMKAVEVFPDICGTSTNNQQVLSGQASHASFLPGLNHMSPSHSMLIGSAVTSSQSPGYVSSPKSPRTPLKSPRTPLKSLRTPLKSPRTPLKSPSILPSSPSIPSESPFSLGSRKAEGNEDSNSPHHKESVSLERSKKDEKHKESEEPKCLFSPSPKKFMSASSDLAVKEKVKKSRTVPTLGLGEENRFDISSKILRALQKKEKLTMSSFDGKRKVCIGNDTWVKANVWEDKFSQVNDKVNTLLNDLAEEVWGYRKLAEMSLKGGVSPKTPDAPQKTPAPIGKVEAILGVYLAHLKWQGMTNELHLKAASKTGENTLRSKMQESARKVMREKKLK